MSKIHVCLWEWIGMEVTNGNEDLLFQCLGCKKIGYVLMFPHSAGPIFPVYDLELFLISNPSMRLFPSLLTGGKET